MSPWQIERQIAWLLGQATWADAPNALVLTGGCVVSSDGAGNFLAAFLPFLPGGGPAELALPYAKVAVVASSPDTEQPERLRVDLDAFVVAGSGGITAETGDTQTDDHGTQALTGWARDPVQGQGKSTGRGLDEVVGRLLEVLAPSATNGHLVDSIHAIQARVKAPVSGVVPVDGLQVVGRPIPVAIYTGTVARRYHAPRRLVATGAAGQITLAWTLAPRRFDSLGQVLRRSVAGGPVPATPTDGVGVAVGATDTAQVIAGLGAGVYQLALFQSYDETSAVPAVADRFSAAATAAATVT